MKTTAIALLVALLAASAALAAKAPTGKTYFVVSIGVATDSSEEYELDAVCVTFNAAGMCSGAECGAWWRTDSIEQNGKQNALAFAFTLTDDETGQPVEIDGQARIDLRGPKSSFGGVARGIDADSGAEFNFAIGGRAVSPGRCARLVEEFESGD